MACSTLSQQQQQQLVNAIHACECQWRGRAGLFQVAGAPLMSVGWGKSMKRKGVLSTAVGCYAWWSSKYS
jgi:hypothetical protein